MEGVHSRSNIMKRFNIVSDTGTSVYFQREFVMKIEEELQREIKTIETKKFKDSSHYRLRPLILGDSEYQLSDKMSLAMYEEHINEKLYTLDYFAHNIHRRSLIITTHSILEVFFRKYFNLISGVSKKLNWKSAISTTEDYATKHPQLLLMVNSAAWQHIQDVALVRHCLVHNDGIVKTSKYSVELREALSRLECIEESNEDSSLLIDQGFLIKYLEALDIILSYFIKSIGIEIKALRSK